MRLKCSLSSPRTRMLRYLMKDCHLSDIQCQFIDVVQKIINCNISKIAHLRASSAKPEVPSNDSRTIFLTWVALSVTFGERYRGGVPECAVVPITTFIGSSSRAKIWPTCSWRIAPSNTSHSCLLSLVVAASLVSGRPTLPMCQISGTASMRSSALLLLRQAASLHRIESRNDLLNSWDFSNSLPGKIALPLDIHTFEKRPFARREPISVVTRVPPARCPHRVTDVLLPPKFSMFSCTHWSAIIISDSP